MFLTQDARPGREITSGNEKEKHINKEIMELASGNNQKRYIKHEENIKITSMQQADSHC